MRRSFLGLSNAKTRLWVFGSLTAAGAIGLGVATVHAGPEWLKTTGALALTLGGAAFGAELWVRITGRVSRLEQRAAQLKPRATPPEPPLVPGWNVPMPTPFFTGREAVLRALRQDFTQHRVVALTGSAGVGKTQIARGYAYTHQFEYDRAFWVSATTRAGLLCAYAEIQRLLGLGLEGVADQEQIAAAVREALGGRDRWLLIFADVEDAALVQEFFPAGAGGHILLTMQAAPPPHVAFARPMAALAEPEGARLLLQRADRLRESQELTDAPPADQADARALSATVEGLPLALDLAGANMARFGLTPGEYRERYATAAQRRRPAEGGGTEPDAVETAFALAFERLPRETAGLLRVCAFLAPDAIPEELLTRSVPDGDAVIRAATRLSLLQRDAERRSLTMHRRVQAGLRESMSAEDQRLWLDRTVRTVSGAFPSAERENWPLWDCLLPHALACAHWIQSESLASFEAAQLLSHVGSHLRKRAQHAAAEPLLRRALAILEKTAGPRHPDTARSLHNLATCYQAQGKLAEADPLLHRALAILEDRLGNWHPDLAKNLHALAFLYGALGKSSEAEPLHQRALAIREKALGPRHPDTATSLYYLAALYHTQEKLIEAEPLYLRALAIRKTRLGPEHPDTASILHSLGMLSYDQGKLREAEPLYQQALAIREEALGAKHVHTVGSLHSLALLYMEQARFQEAEVCYQRALATYEEVYGPEHLDTGRTLNNLAMLYHTQGRLAEAEALHQRASAIAEKELGRKHSFTAASLNNLAMLYHTQGRLMEAEPLLHQALAIKEEVLGARHTHTAWSLDSLATLYHTQGKLTEAEPLHQRALAIREEVLGSRHPHTAKSLHNLARLVADQGKPAEAERLYQRALAIQEPVLGPQHPDTAKSLEGLALLHRAQGRPAEAEPLLQRALAIFTEALGPEHPDTAACRANYATVQAELQKTCG